MKYIRTKDGIYEVIEECFKPMENNMVFTPREGLTKILKQADSIEELCDEFVLAKNDYFEYTIFRLFTTAKSLKLESVKNKEVVANIYGAIWTDKGLIYVAKMNEKGKLEL